MALITGTILLLVLTNTVIFQECMKRWEWPFQKKENMQSTYRYGIVLGGMGGYDSDRGIFIFGNGMDRLMQAALLKQTGMIEKLVITGGSGRLIKQEEKEALHVQDYLNALGISNEDLVIESNSRNTRENALLTKEVLGNEAMAERCLLITSAYHMRRSRACFEKAGFQVDPYPTDFYTDSESYNFADIFIPFEGNLHHWSVLIHEVVGYLAYWIVGYL